MVIAFLLLLAACVLAPSVESMGISPKKFWIGIGAFIIFAIFISLFSESTSPKNSGPSLTPTEALIDRQRKRADEDYNAGLRYMVEFERKTGRAPTAREIQEAIDSRNR